MDSLVQPIADDAVCGEYLKGNKTLYRALRNHYNQAQSSYRQLMESPDAASDDELVEQNIENWNALGKVCRACLIENAKDVEIFGWYISAQLFSPDPLGNMRSAVADLLQVIERYWDELHPKPPVEKLKSDDDAGRAREWAEFKIKPMWQLAGESEGTGILAMPLLNLSLIGSINYTQFYSAERSGKLESLKAQAVSFFGGEREKITERIHALAGIEADIKRIEVLVNENCSRVAAKTISFQFLLKSVTNLLNAIKFLLADSYSVWPLDVQEDRTENDVVNSDNTADDGAKQQNESSEVPQSQEVIQSIGELQQAQGANVQSPALAVGCLSNRDQAFTELRKISEFFQRTEPHSPVHMLLERAIRWGYMPLPELLAEMVGENDQVMGRISQMAGLESVEKTVIPDVDPSSTPLDTLPAGKIEVQQTVSENNQKSAEGENSQPSSSGISNFQW